MTTGPLSVDLPLERSDGRVGTLRISCLPGAEVWLDQPVLIDGTGSSDPLVEPVQLLEDCEYRYQVELADPSWRVCRHEMLVPSDASGREGRLRPGRRTGATRFEVESGDRVAVSPAVEIRSRKLDYLDDYRRMLTGIAEVAAELIQQRFAPSELASFHAGDFRNTPTRYQQLAYISAVLDSNEVRGALEHVVARPHESHRAVPVERSPLRGIPGGSRLVPALTRPGRRLDLPRPIGRLTSVPERVLVEEHRTTYDTVPNRFVKFTLERWLRIVEDRAVDGSSEITRERAERLRRDLVRRLRGWLDRPLFREVGQLDSFPVGDTVLERRPGYRELMAAFLRTEAAGLLDWSTDESHRAGQRDVAALYETWCFLELVRAVRQVSGFEVDVADLARRSPDGVALTLASGDARRLSAVGQRRNRRVELGLWFNRSFSTSSKDPDARSWTDRLRPDCSVRITLTGSERPPVWLHFDAKYRITTYREILRDPETADDATDAAQDREMPADLMKMHAYRDAIERTSGAYVLYPGSSAERRTARYHEILPGIGAFAFRPGADGHVDHESVRNLVAFLEDVIDHVAADGTADERSRFWSDLARADRSQARIPAQPELTKPAADTTVLLGHVRSETHLDWILRSGTYNVRADDRRGAVTLSSPVFSADLVALYRSDHDDVQAFALPGRFRVVDGEQLAASGYPSPSGRTYCCLDLGNALPLLGAALRGRTLAEVAASMSPGAVGAPVVVSWASLASRPGVVPAD